MDWIKHRFSEVKFSFHDLDTYPYLDLMKQSMLLYINIEHCYTNSKWYKNEEENDDLIFEYIFFKTLKLIRKNIYFFQHHHNMFNFR